MREYKKMQSEVIWSELKKKKIHWMDLVAGVTETEESVVENMKYKTIDKEERSKKRMKRTKTDFWNS